MVRRLQILFLVLVLVSCTHIIKVPLEPVENYLQKKKINLNVALHITEELKNAKWERHSMGDTWILPLGDAFVQNAELMSRELFTNVIVKNDITSLHESEVDAILTPKMILVEQSIGVTAFSDNTITTMFEWSLKDLKGDIVWVDTIKGEATTHGGNIFTYKKNYKKRVKALIEDLFQKSFQAISSSSEIRELADTQKR